MAKSGNPTTYDVARLANVSQMTVSRVMRSQGQVSQEVIDKVHQAADELGYVKNRVAGALAGQATNLVGVVLPTLTNTVFTDVLAGLNDAIKNSDLQPVFGVSNYDQLQEYELVKDMLAWRPAAIVLTGLEHDARTQKLLKASNTKIAEIIDVDGDPISACFGLSHRKAGATMAHHLIDRGHTRFGFVGCGLETDVRATKRFDAFNRILEERGHRIEREITASDRSSMKTGRDLTAALLSDITAPIALYYSNDDLAAGGLMHCLAAGIDVPDQVAIASFNGLDFLEAMPLQITTIKSPRYTTGQRAGRYLLDDNLLSHVPYHEELAGELIRGQTTF